MGSRRLRKVLVLLAIGLPAAALAQDARAPRGGPEPAPSQNRPEPVRDEPGSWEMTAEQQKAIERGLDQLARWQLSSGFWGTASGASPYRMSITAVAGLAFLAHGDAPGRGPYGAVLERAVRWVLKHQYPENHPSGAGGLLYDTDDANADASVDNVARPMHGHGYATLFLAEAYGQSSDPETRRKIHEALVRAVRLTERTQSTEGGWFYQPRDRKDEGSVTITQIQGLRAARNAGIQVKKTTIDRAVQYIHDSQLKTGDKRGGVRYTVHYGEPSPALTAAGIAVYYGAGEYGSPDIEAGFSYLAKNMRIDDRTRFWFYTHLYAVQAMFHRGGPEWASYFPQLRQQLLGARLPNGTWDDPFAGDRFGTACAVLCLEVPLQYLPIFQR